MERGVQRMALSTGIEVALAEHGDPSGPAVLLLHAWCESLRSFDRLLPLLPPSWHVVAVDGRGHGGSDRPDDGYDLPSLAADVDALVAALELTSVVLVGASSGGYVAQQVAVRRPAWLRGLVLIGSPADLRGRPAFADEVDALTDPIDPAWARDFLEAFPRFHDVPEWYVEDRVKESAGIPARMWQQSLHGLLGSVPPLTTGVISAPTLILSGDRDDVLPEQQSALASSIRRSTQVRYADVGHLVLWEQPERVAEDVIAFIRNLPRLDRELQGRL